MEESWINFLKEIHTTILEFESNGCDLVCYRGHSDSNWNLESTLFVQQERLNWTNDTLKNIENISYFDFLTNAGNLISPNLKDWEILFLMRHHGIPTRILDWTESFGTALFFALSENPKSPTIWILDPYQLNKISYRQERIPNPLSDFKFTYEQAYIEKTVNSYVNPVAIIPPRNSDRLFAQKGLFTLQGSNNKPINKIPELSNCYKKIEIPIDAIKSAKKFLKLFGINNYSIFPDLDGLSKHITQTLFK